MADDDFEGWELPVRLGTTSEQSRTVRLYLARGERLRLVGEGEATREELLALSLEVPGVLVATTTTEPIGSVEELVDAAWVAVVEGTARLVLSWDFIWADWTYHSIVDGGVVPLPAISHKRLTRVIKLLGRPSSTLSEADDPLEDWLYPPWFRSGAICLRGDRIMKNARWFLTDGRRIRAVHGGDLSRSDLTRLAVALPPGLAFVATGERAVFRDPPVSTVKALADEARAVVMDEQLHWVVSAPGDIDQYGRVWVRVGYRYARKQFRLISTGDVHLLAVTREQLLERLQGLGERRSS